MWKFMVVDDEPKIRRGLTSLVEREISGASVVAEAEDGETALALVLSHAPDILLVDVRMPFMDGLEFVERLSAMPGERAVIMVSGHDEFSYAQRALKSKVSDYLLKPVSADILRAAVEKAQADLFKRRSSSSWQSWARKELERNLPALREDFLRSLLSGGLSVTEFEERSGFLDLSIENRSVLLACRLPERLSSLSAVDDFPRWLSLSALLAILRRILGELYPCALLLPEEDEEMAVALLPPVPENAIAAVRERVEREVSLALQVRPELCHAEVHGDFTAIPETWEELVASFSPAEGSEVFVTLARNYLEGHYDDPNLSLEEVAREIQISPGYLSRMMKRETGSSFVDYLTRLRIKKAVSQMSDPGAKVFEVAEAVGYRSQHYFARAFKKVLGVSPSEYRKGALS